MTNTILRVIWCANLTVAVEAVALGNAMFAVLNIGCLLAISGVLVQRRAVQR